MGADTRGHRCRPRWRRHGPGAAGTSREGRTTTGPRRRADRRPRGSHRATRPQGGAEGVTDEIWAEVNAHFTEEQIGAVNLENALTDFFNRINRTLREPAGQTWG